MSQLQALTKPEILSVLKLAASESKRNHAMILLAFKHGLRASEVCSLKMTDIDLKNGTVVVRRLKGSLKSSQDLLDLPGQPLVSEKRVLKAWLEERATYHDSSDFLFLSQKGGMMDRSAFSRVFSSIAERGGLPRKPRLRASLRKRFLSLLHCSHPNVAKSFDPQCPRFTGRFYFNGQND